MNVIRAHKRAFVNNRGCIGDHQRQVLRRRAGSLQRRQVEDEMAANVNRRRREKSCVISAADSDAQ